MPSLDQSLDRWPAAQFLARLRSSHATEPRILPPQASLSRQRPPGEGIANELSFGAFLCGVCRVWLSCSVHQCKVQGLWPRTQERLPTRRDRGEWEQCPGGSRNGFSSRWRGQCSVVGTRETDTWWCQIAKDSALETGLVCLALVDSYFAGSQQDQGWMASSH